MTDFADIFTFARASTATFIDPATGKVMDAGVDQPRFESSGALIERSRTNLITYSEYQNDVFTPNSNVITTETMKFRSGVDSKCCYFDDAAEDKYAFRSFTPPSTQSYAISFFVEFFDDIGAPTFSGSSTSNQRPFCIYIGGAFTTGGETVQRLSDKIYRISAFKFASTASSDCGVYRFATNQIRPFKVSGFQVEQPSFASSYIPTEASQVTRSADSFLRAALSGSFYNDQSGTFYIEYESSSDSLATTYTPLDGESSDDNDIISYVGGTGFVAKNDISSATYPGTVSESRLEKIAFSADSEKWILARNGESVELPTPAGDNILDMTSIILVNGWAKIKSFKYWGVRLSSSDLEDMTS